MTGAAEASAHKGDKTAEQQREAVVVGLLAAPGLAHDLALRLRDELPGRLRRRFPDVEWRIAVETEPVAAASNSDVDLIETARRRALEKGWKLAICLTDFPVHVGTRPVTAYASAAQGVGLISVPALGAVNLQERVTEAALHLIEGLLGETVDSPEQSRDAERRARMNDRLEELASPVGRKRVERGGVWFVGAVVLGNLRLLLGMVRANRPWRLVTGMSRALVGALGLDIFGVASPGVWIIASGLGTLRLAAVGAASVLLIAAALIVFHRLWEHSTSPRPEARERVVLFNLVTAITVAIGVLTMYLVLFALNVVSATVLIDKHVLAKQTGSSSVGASDYLALAWLVTSLATLGGALGAALENDHVVRGAAYGYRRDARIEAEGQQA